MTPANTLMSNQGNGGHHGNSYSGTVVYNNGSNGHGNAAYTNCNKSSNSQKCPFELLVTDALDGRTEELEKLRLDGVSKELKEGDEVDDELGDRLGEGIQGLEEELASNPMFNSSAPLARCEESSM